MAIVKLKSITPGSRFTVRVKPDNLHKGDPEYSLLVRITSYNVCYTKLLRHKTGIRFKQAYFMFGTIFNMQFLLTLF